MDLAGIHLMPKVSSVFVCLDKNVPSVAEHVDDGGDGKADKCGG